MNYQCLILLIFFCSFGRGFSQDRVVDKKVTYWTRAYIEVNLNDKVQLDLELDNRRYIEPHRQFQTVARFTLAAQQNSWFSIGTGITYSLLYSQLTNLSQPEIRPHQEVNASHSSNLWKFNHRLRLEQRFMQDTTRIRNGEVIEFRENSYDFSFRTRYEIEAAYTIVNRNSNRGHLDLNASSEIMVNTSLREIFDTFRQYAGVTYFIDPKRTLEVGYLKSLEMNHTYNTLFNFDNIRVTYRQSFN